MTASAELTWVCVGCRGAVPMAADVCPACGWSMQALEEPTAPKTTRQLRNIGLGVKELVIVNLLFILWRVIGDHSLAKGAGATARGLDIWRAERALHIPSERAVQNLVIHHAWLTHLLDDYYAWVHIASVVIFLAWLWFRHRDRYAGWRNILVAFTALSLLISLIPVAPPRLLPSLHIVDTAMRDHTSVYAGIGKGITDQFSAVPSDHVGWAVLIALVVITVSTSRWRWLILAQPLITVFAVVATGNHFWFDGFAAVVLLAAVVGLAQLEVVRKSALLSHVQLPSRFGDRATDRGIDREGLSQLVDGEVVLHGE